MSPRKISRKKLKHNYIRIKNEIRQTALDYGGLFTSHDVITGEIQWVDFCFLSKKEKIPWNACIDTAKLAYQDKISEKARNELNQTFGADWHTRYEWLRIREKELPDTGKVFINESIEIDCSYRFGRGLHNIKNVENITVDVINKFIEVFLEQGEGSFKSKEMLTFKSSAIRWGFGIVNQLRYVYGEKQGGCENFGHDFIMQRGRYGLSRLPAPQLLPQSALVFLGRQEID